MSIDDPCVQDRRVPADVEFATARAVGGGRSLESSVQAVMNRHFGQDLSRVRVHTDSEADTLNLRLRARAFTVGSDIFFRRGEYDPSSLPGQMLIAHELAHVVQQRMNRVPRHGTGMRLRPAHDALEREADEVAWAFAAGQPLFLKAHPRRAIEGAPTPTTASRARVIQRTADSVGRHAVRGVPRSVGAVTCHVAALGWLIKGLGRRHGWDLTGKLRDYAPPNLDIWLPQHLYNPRVQLTQPMVAQQIAIPGGPALARGDILFTWDGTAGTRANHSMVVTGTTAAVGGNDGTTIIRGFNNHATFLPTMIGAHPEPVIAAYVYDPNPRNVADNRLWNMGRIGNLNLYRVTYNDAVAALTAVVFPQWLHHWFRTKWRHATPPAGCAAACPHTCAACLPPVVPAAPCAHVPT